MAATLDKRANPKIPRYISRQYVFGARGFRREKRENLRRTLTGLDALMLGCLHIPGGAEPIKKIKRQLLQLQRQMSVKEWGE